MKKNFDPEKYGMMFCTDCKGKGKLPRNPEGFDVCSRCGGSGVIKKMKKTSKEERE
jgi:DnaJ-class molecular chaperone